MNDILDLCSFIAPYGRRITISQTIMSENVVLTIRTDGELSENDRTATERFITEGLHLELGKRVSGSTFVETGTERLLSTSVTYCENDLYGRRRKAVNEMDGVDFANRLAFPVRSCSAKERRRRNRCCHCNHCPLQNGRSKAPAPLSSIRTSPVERSIPATGGGLCATVRRLPIRCSDIFRHFSRRKRRYSTLLRWQCIGH